MRIVWSPRFDAELESEGDWIARERPLVALAIVKRMQRATERLVRFPFSGRRVPEFPRLPVREVIVPPYRIVYVPEPGRVLLLTLKHSRELLTANDLRPGYP